MKDNSFAVFIEVCCSHTLIELFSLFGDYLKINHGTFKIKKGWSIIIIEKYILSVTKVKRRVPTLYSNV